VPGTSTKFLLTTPKFGRGKLMGVKQDRRA
jgi:hypothetical protein